MSVEPLDFREATANDIATLVQMLADDPLGAKRENYELPLPEVYLKAFEAIDKDPNNELIVAKSGETIVGFMQLTFIPYLTYQGGWRATVEGVRVNKQFRSQGVGKQLFEWGINRANERGCHLFQLTTDKQRPDAIKFYESLGFKATHEGMKLHLSR